MTTVVREHRTPVAPGRPQPRARSWDAAGVAVMALILAAAGAARPSLWFDEAATISAASRPVPDLWRMVHNIDAVHGLYYLAMHGWFTVFPATEFFSRLSSATAVALAAAGVVVLGRQLSGRAVAVTAGVLFALLPRVTWAGAETRSYAMTIAAAVWLTVLCVVAMRRDRPRWWLLYGVLASTSGLLNVFLILLLPVHAVVVVLYSSCRRTTAHWAAAASSAAAAVLPLLAFSQTQLFQVRWIPPLSSVTVGEITREQYFGDALPFALLAGAIIVCGLLCLGQIGSVTGDSPGRLVLLCVSWVAIPTAVLLVYSMVRQPIYYPRYLAFTAPAVALLLGLCVVAIGRSRAAVIGIVMLFAVTAVPEYLTQRGPYAKEQMDYSQVADVIDAHAAPGDCLILDNSAAWKPGPIRPLTAARPAVYRKLQDYGRGMTGIARKRLWDNHIAVWAWADKLPGCPALWTVTERDPAVPDYQRGPALDPGARLARTMAYQVPGRFGFRVVERWQFSFAQVVKSTR